MSLNEAHTVHSDEAVSHEHEQPPSDQHDGVSPEWHLLGMVGVIGWIAAVGYVGATYAWPWSWVVALGPLVLLIVKGALWPSEDPAAYRRAERDRKIAEEHEYIASLGGGEETEKSDATRQAIQDARLRQIAIDNEFHESERAHRAAKSTPSQPLSAPRRVLRWIAQGLLLLIMVPLAVVFYGSLLLGPPLMVFGVASLVVDNQWALIPAVLTVPLSGWFVWWWIRRASDSTVRMAGIGMAAGAGFGGGS